jgi:hypothetical protein
VARVYKGVPERKNAGFYLAYREKAQRVIIAGEVPEGKNLVRK